MASLWASSLSHLAGLGSPLRLFYLGLLINFIILFSIGQRFGRLRELMRGKKKLKIKQINLLFS